MDYEKLHKNTIANLQEMVNSGKITVKIARKICADFTPESEDERIKQEMIAMFSNAEDYGLKKEFAKRAIAWLKKQSEPIKINPSENDEQNTYKNGIYQESNGVRIWHNGHTFLVPKDWNKGEWPLLNKNGIENSEREKQHLMNEIDALLDWKFVAATKHIKGLGTDIPLKDGEYLITAPVWLTMYKYRVKLNKALSNIGAMEIDFNKSFWLAQQSSIKRTWYFFGYNGSLANSYVTFAYQVGVITL